MKIRKDNGNIKYNVVIEIEPADGSRSRRKISMNVLLLRSNSGYGNDLYMSVKNTVTEEYMALIDLRYADIHNKTYEELVIGWMYGNWSGENGSWRIHSLKITEDTRYTSNAEK